MKKAFLLLALLMSANAFAIVCESEENPGKKLKLVTQPGKLVSGQLLTDKTEHLFVGKKSGHFLGEKSFELFNQDGVAFTFKINEQIAFPQQHCRTRVCNPLPIPVKSTGKLLTQGLEDEYFTCL